MANNEQLPLFSAAHNALIDNNNGWDVGRTLTYYHNSLELREAVIHALTKEIELNPQSAEDRVRLAQNRLRIYAPMYRNGEETWFTHEHFDYLFSAVFGLTQERGWQVVRNNPDVQRLARELVTPPEYQDPPRYSPGQPPSYPTAIRQPVVARYDEGRTNVLVAGNEAYSPEELRAYGAPAPRAVPLQDQSFYLEEDEDLPDAPATAEPRPRSRHVHFDPLPQLIPILNRDAVPAEVRGYVDQVTGEFFESHGGADPTPFFLRAAANSLDRNRPPTRGRGVPPTAPQLGAVQRDNGEFASSLTGQLNQIGNSPPSTPPGQTGHQLQDPRRANDLRRSNAVHFPNRPPPASGRRFRLGPNGSWYEAAAGQGGYITGPPPTRESGGRGRLRRDGSERERGGERGSTPEPVPAPGSRTLDGAAGGRTLEGRVRKGRKGSDESEKKGPSRNLRKKRGSK